MRFQESLKLFNAAIYIRLSREDGDKEESDSVGNQRKLLTEYVQKREDLLLYDEYIDDGYTGTKFDRPEFQRMISDVETGAVDCIIVKDLSRFGRDYIETGRYLERYFPEKGVRFISITDNIDSMKQAYDMLLPIKNIFNEQYARDISKKVHTAVKTKQKSGEFIGAFTSYGYKKSPADKNKLIIDEYAAEVVRRIFALYIQGYGKIRIAQLLNEEGVLCPSEYKKTMGLNYRNSNKLESTSYWCYSTVNNILHKEIYVGNMVQGKTYQYMRRKTRPVDKSDWIVVENTHEPIIDRETWEKAQTLLTRRTRKLDFESNVNIFAGFVKCGDCGRALVKTQWRSPDGTKRCSMSCGTYKRNGKQFCTPHTLPLKVLEGIVLSDLKAIIQNVDDLRESVKKQKFAVPKAEEIANAEIDRMKDELERIKRLKQSVYEDYKEELISKEEYLSYRKEYLKKEELCVKQMETAEKKKGRNVTEDVFESPWLKRLLDLKDIEVLDRGIVVEMINEIKVYENRTIKITYNFSNELEHLFSNAYSVKKEVI